MDINKKDQKNRTELKGYFIKNSIPTQKQFEELIDGMLNQKDDGIAKPSVSDPLSIQAVGDTAKVINFYEDFKNDKPAWTLLLKPHIDPAKPETVKSGFCISDGQGNNRLFIDSGTGNVSINGGVGITGNVGIGTPSNPLYSLDISSPSAIRFDFGVTEEDINGDVSDGGQLIVTGGFNGVKLLAGIGNNSLTLGIQESIPTLVLGANGADLYGNVRIDGDLILDNRKTYNSTISFGYLSDPDRAWIKYYSEPSKASRTLVIGISKDADDHIALMPSGNVGIGTISPNGKLDIANIVRFGLDEGGSGAKSISFAKDTGDEINAGKITYKGTLGNSSLNIIGAGSSNTTRQIKLYDNVEVVGTLKVNGGITGSTLNVTGLTNVAALQVSGGSTLNTLNVTGSTSVGALQVNDTLQVKNGINGSSLQITGLANVKSLNVADIFNAKSGIFSGALISFLTVERNPSDGKRLQMEPDRIQFNNSTDTTDAAWIRYYSRNPADVDVAKKEQMTLEIGVSDNTNDHIALMPSGNVGIGTNTPLAKFSVIGNAMISNGSGYAVPNGFMASGSLTIGSITASYGGGSGFTANTAGLMLETLTNTEIAVHDYGQKVSSLMYYEGDANNRITIGRDMGWGAIGSVVINGDVGIGNGDLNIAGGKKFYSPGRMHIHGEERLYLLNKSGVYIGKDWGGTGDLLVDGVITASSSKSPPTKNIYGVPDAVSGIRFADNPGGGGQDAAWIQYYARSGESCTLEIGVSDNTDDHIALMPSGNVGIGTVTPPAKLSVIGTGMISDGSGVAVPNANMASGSLTLGGVKASYGGGSGWNANTAGLMLETLANTEIAVHDVNTRIASLMYYEGDAVNRITIGRDMGWGAISSVLIRGSFINISGAGNEQAYIGGDGSGNDVQIGSTNSGVVNIAAYNTATGYMNFICKALTQSSDIRYKENIKPIENALDKINKLRGITHYWKETESEKETKSDELNSDRKEHIGLIAQEVNDVLPEVVSIDRNGYYGISYTSIIPVLIEAIKEIKTELDRLAKKQSQGK